MNYREFDDELYGVMLRHQRRKKYKRAEDFCREVCDRTGIQINKECLYRIENGKQPPTVKQYVAFGCILEFDDFMLTNGMLWTPRDTQLKREREADEIRGILEEAMS